MVQCLIRHTLHSEIACYFLFHAALTCLFILYSLVLDDLQSFLRPTLSPTCLVQSFWPLRKHIYSILNGGQHPIPMQLLHLVQSPRLLGSKQPCVVCILNVIIYQPIN